MIDKILVVCTGNICRSPFGERLLQQKVPDLTVDSAGTNAVVDHDADQTANDVSKRHYQLDLTGHNARQLDDAMCHEYDLILAMEQYHVNFIAKISPVSTGKTMLYAHWLPDTSIHDPYRKSEQYCTRVFEKMARAATLWQQKLQGQP